MTVHTDGLPGVSPILTANLLGRLYALNLDYLDLLIDERTDPRSSGLRHLPERLLDALAHTTVDVRQTLATTSFALYSLGFEDQDFWCTALRSSGAPAITARYRVLSATAMQTSFCELALLYAWHVAVTQPLAARMFFGMPTTVVERMLRLHLWQLRRVAMDFPGLLMPRWPTNPCFWPDMLKFASSGDLRRLETVQQLGHQLIAVDLQASGARRSATRQRQRNLMMQRLRRAKAI